MDPVRAGRVYLSERILADPRSRRRAEALAEAIQAPIKEVLDSRRIDELQHSLPWEALPRRGREKEGFEDRTIFLDGMHWEREDTLFPGYSWRELRTGRHEWKVNGVVCQTAVEIQTILGCAFDCSYCPYTSSITVACDLERFADELDRLLLERPSQALYKLNNRSDTLAFEPEYGLTRLLVDRFARTEDKYLMLYSKSANVSPLRELDHRGHTICCFTLSTPSTARLLEREAPSPEARIEAAASCAAAGYPVRFRFSPIVPFVGWREELRELVRTMASRLRPELITLWTLSMIELAELERIVALDDLDPSCLSAAREAQRGLAGAKGAPFPEWLRSEIYEVASALVAEHSPETRLALCLETPGVIERLRGRLAVLGSQQVCNCAPGCTPDRVALAAPAADPRRREPLLLPSDG